MHILALFRNRQAAAVHEGTSISLLPDPTHHSIKHNLEEINHTRKSAFFLWEFLLKHLWESAFH